MSSKTAGAILIVLGILGLVFTLTMLDEQKNYAILLSVLILIGFVLVALPKKPQISIQLSPSVAPAASPLENRSVAPQPSAAPPEKKEPVRKECPSCSEKIILEARRCRFCGEIFDPETLKSQIEAGRAQAQS